MPALELLHPELPGLIDALLEDAGRSWEQLYAGQVEFAGQPIDLDRLQWALIDADPVLWVETHFVRKPEEGGGLWELFDYQKASMRYRGDTVHQDGAEVGKTLEIVGLCGWGIHGERKGSTLVASARDGDLDEIYESLLYQYDQHSTLARQLVRKTTKPYRKLTFRGDLKIYFRPAGYDGQPFRALHVRARGLFDEAAKVENKQAYNEFFRALMPDAEARLYSVPTGTETDYQRIADRAIPAERLLPAEWSPRQLLRLMRGDRLGDLDGRSVPADRSKSIWVRFHWPKTLMPYPFWSEERRLEFIERYGGVDSPGYQHNVLGEPGDPESSVFPSRLLDPVTEFDPLWRTVSLRWDHKKGKLDIEVRRLNPLWGANEGGDPGETGDQESEAPALAPYVVDRRDTVDVAGFVHWSLPEREAFIAALVASVVSPIPGRLVAGSDVGSSGVTEIFVEREEHAGDRRLSLRLQLTGWNWADQRMAIVALHGLLGLSGLGIDTTGVGQPLYDEVYPYLGDVVAGYVFNKVTAAINQDDGEVRTDPQTGAEMTVTYKELGTQCIERDLQRCRGRLPRDPELLHELQCHTFSEKGGKRRYSKVNDHIVDAWRTLALRRLSALYGAGAPIDAPAYVPPNSRLESLSGLAAFLR